MALTRSPMISTYFSWDEVIHTVVGERKGLDNLPPTEIVPAIQYTAACMDRVRKLLNRPIIVSSWYRSPEVNKAVGSKTAKSQHCKGEAVDFICPSYGSPRDVAKVLADNLAILKFDQLIYEFTWVHISFSINPRGQILTLDSKTGKATQGII